MTKKIGVVAARLLNEALAGFLIAWFIVYLLVVSDTSVHFIYGQY